MTRDEARRERARAEKYVQRTSREISKWVEFFDGRQKGTAPSFFNMESDRDAPGSSVTYSSWLERFYTDNEAGKKNWEAAKQLIPLLDDMSRRCPADYTPFFIVERNPSILRTWRAGETERDKGYLDAFDYACRLAARRLYDKTKHLPDGPVEIKVVVNPEDEEVASKRHAQKIDTAYSDRVIVEELEALEKQQREKGEPITRKAAMGWLADKKGKSPARIRKAIENENRRKLEEEEESA